MRGKATVFNFSNEKSYVFCMKSNDLFVTFSWERVPVMIYNFLCEKVTVLEEIENFVTFAYIKVTIIAN